LGKNPHLRDNPSFQFHSMLKWCKLI